MTPDLFAALGEPNRLRIVELLGAAPRSVGEIATALRLRQPQVTKHLQTLRRAGLVTVYPRGQRRIYALRRAPLRELRAWLAPFEADRPSERVMDEYERAVADERARLAGAGGGVRELRFARLLGAPPAAVWAAWTSASAVRRWWSPTHFTVAECEVEPVAGGRLRIVLREGDGTRHTAAGRFLAVDPPSALGFELAPLDGAGAPLLAAVHRLRLRPRGAGTALSLTIRASTARPEAAAALAGLRPGWAQLLDKLAAALEAPTG